MGSQHFSDRREIMCCDTTYLATPSSRVWGSTPLANASVCLQQSTYIFTLSKINKSGFVAKWLCYKLTEKASVFRAFLIWVLQWIMYRQMYFIKKIQKDEREEIVLERNHPWKMETKWNCVLPSFLIPGKFLRLWKKRLPKKNRLLLLYLWVRLWVVTSPTTLFTFLFSFLITIFLSDYYNIVCHQKFP